MIRIFNIILAIACVLALTGVYGLKFQSEGIASQKITLTEQIADQHKQLALLRADWAYVNQPGYLEPIITRHADTLDLVIADAKQFKAIDDLPMRPAEPDADALTALLNSLEAGVDPIAALIEAN
jgi:hypothetical protein